MNHGVTLHDHLVALMQLVAADFDGFMRVHARPNDRSVGVRFANDVDDALVIDHQHRGARHDQAAAGFPFEHAPHAFAQPKIRARRRIDHHIHQPGIGVDRCAHHADGAGERLALRPNQRFDAQSGKLVSLNGDCGSGTSFLVMREGELVFEGSERELFSIEDPYVRKFIT